jgi:hypothetical protein
MSLLFTAAQLAEINRLATGTGSVPYNNMARPYSGVYTYVLHLISINGDAAQGPLAGVEPGIWNWFRGAALINRGEGVFSAFIREYTAEQSRIRTGDGVSVADMNKASDEIGRLVVRDINEAKGLIELSTIGNNDSAGMLKVINQVTPAGWSGNLLFPLLGEEGFFEKNITKNDPSNSYNFFAMMRSATYALSRVLGGPVHDITEGLKTLYLISFGSTATLDFSKLAAVASEALSFFDNLYDESLVSPVLPRGLPGAFGLSLANSFLFSHVVIGEGGNAVDMLHATLADDVIHGGGGNDIIFASDAPLSANLGFDSDLIDGGAGDDWVIALGGSPANDNLHKWSAA